MHVEEQRYWADLLNVAAAWREDVEVDVTKLVPERFRDFQVHHHWPVKKATAYLRNNLEALRAAYVALEAGEHMDYDSINHVLESCQIRLFDWGDATALRAIRRSKASRGARLESLQLVGPREKMNPGSTFIRGTIERAFYYFSRYADHRLADPEYPDATPDTLRAVACAKERCPRIFLRELGNERFCADRCRGGSR